MLNTTYPMTLSKGSINGQAVPKGWQEQGELATEIVAADTSNITRKAWLTLISAIEYGLPVVLTTSERNWSSRKNDYITTKVRKTVIVEYATVGNRSSSIRVHYWGFAHNVYLSDIADVDTPEVEYPE